MASEKNVLYNLKGSLGTGTKYPGLHTEWRGLISQQLIYKISYKRAFSLSLALRCVAVKMTG